MMPHQVWASKAKNLMLDGTDRQKRFWIGLSDTPELDRAGRILITPILRTGASLNGEVVLLGVGENLEVWDSHRLARHKEIVRQNNEQ
jgi:DNA-binding transcriptional regulator/RsmH inhibitor MraZ